MKSTERIKLAIEGKEADRVPILMISKDFSIFQAGLELGECLADPQKFVDAELRTLEKYGCDGVWDLHIAMPLLNELYGNKLTVSKSLDGMDQPAHAQPVLGDLKEMKKLKEVEVLRHPCMKPVKFIVRKLKDSVGSDVPVFGWAPPPFRTACMYRSVPQMMMDLIIDPERSLDLMEICMTQSIDYAKVLIDSGADYIWISNPTASSTVISRAHYEKFVHPFTRRLCQEIDAMGCRVLYHICGTWKDRLDLLDNENVTIFHVDKLGVGEAKEKFPRACIMGNVKSVETLVYGDPNAVKTEALRCLGDAGEGGRFILSADCIIPPKTPAENFQALVDTGKVHGIYPLSKNERRGVCRI